MSELQSQPTYKFYATLLDTFQSYLDSSTIYQQYYGSSENPKLTEDEFEKEKFNDLINRINRVPFESEPADKGTAFNEVIDCLIENRKSEVMVIKSNKESRTISVEYKQHTFVFGLDLCLQFGRYLKGALTQQLVEAPINTKYGPVLLYGYIDQLLPFKVVDIKTTKQYTIFKYRNNWQHLVYPYCLIQNGNLINDFEYMVTDFKNVFTEGYTYKPERDESKIIEHCERFIEFLEANKELITDKKIFANE